MVKKLVLFGSMFLVVMFSILILFVDVLHYKFCSTTCINIGESFFIFPFIFLFSLITYFAPGQAFKAWWKFARISIPIIFILSLAINLELHHDPQGELQNMFDLPVLIFLYSIFVIGSVIQIYRGWRQV